MIAAVLERGPAWDPALPFGEQVGFEQHVSLITSLLDQGVAIEAGPFSDPSLLAGGTLLSLALFVFESVEAARALFATDPLVSDAVASLHVHAWGRAALRRG